MAVMLTKSASASSSGLCSSLEASAIADRVSHLAHYSKGSACSQSVSFLSPLRGDKTCSKAVPAVASRKSASLRTSGGTRGQHLAACHCTSSDFERAWNLSTSMGALDSCLGSYHVAAVVTSRGTFTPAGAEDCRSRRSDAAVKRASRGACTAAARPSSCESHDRWQQPLVRVHRASKAEQRTPPLDARGRRCNCAGPSGEGAPAPSDPRYDSRGSAPEESAEAPPSVGTRAALALLRFYKREISPALPGSCRFVPTCSEYSMTAFRKYGVAKGFVLTAWRLARCNPFFGEGGFDPPRWFDEPRPPPY
eukprot:jgi/Mesen1/5667/ME000288S04878